MKYDWLACESFDSASIRPLEGHELESIRKACDQFNTNFNGGYVDGGRYVFEAKPSNLEDLDYDFYEFGGHHWRGDHGYGFTCVWGTILVESFGFEWAAMKNARSLKDCLLTHHGANHNVFPWQYLWGIVESTGQQYSKVQSAWLKIVESVDSSISVPDGWHPAIDALQGRDTEVPAHVLQELCKLEDTTGSVVRHLGFDVYQWTAETDWDDIKRRIRMACGEEWQ